MQKLKLTEKKKEAICINNLFFSYENEEIFKDLNLKIYLGDYTAIIGHNGSGKTTLLKLILGFLKPKKGEIYILGQRQNKFKNWEKISYIPQNPEIGGFYVPVTVREIINMEKTDEKGINEVLDYVGLADYKNKLLRELSGGQRQRVFIARALVKKPEILILDEPTIGVDFKTQENFYNLLNKLNKEKSITIILVSHDLHTVSHQAKTIIQLDRKAYSYKIPEGNKINCSLSFYE